MDLLSGYVKLAVEDGPFTARFPIKSVGSCHNFWENPWTFLLKVKGVSLEPC